MFIDFTELKQRVSIETAASLLRLSLKPGNNQLRGPCPTCKEGGDRALVITPGKGAFYCFALKKGGDQIALAAHILDLSVKDAAQELASRAGLGTNTGTVSTRNNSKSTVPESEGAKEGARTFQALTYLEPEHDAVSAVGFDTDFAKAHGIGYAPKGILRGTVAIPFRDAEGNLLGYIGATELTLPPTFMGQNIVDFGKKRA